MNEKDAEDTSADSRVVSGTGLWTALADIAAGRIRLHEAASDTEVIVEVSPTVSLREGQLETMASAIERAINEE